MRPSGWMRSSSNSHSQGYGSPSRKHRLLSHLPPSLDTITILDAGVTDGTGQHPPSTSENKNNLMFGCASDHCQVLVHSFDTFLGDHRRVATIPCVGSSPRILPTP